MKTTILSLFFLLAVGYAAAQPIPADSLYLAQVRPGSTPVIFQLQSSSGLRPVERISISSDGKEIYYSELDGWPPSNSRIKCYKYLDNKWQGPFIVSEGFVAPGLSINDSTLYMQKDINNVSWTYYSRKSVTGWTAPVKLLSTNQQTHYFQETLFKNYYLASTPGGNSDICRLVINYPDTTIMSLGKPINLSAIENDFFIARDETYIIFFRLYPHYDLYITYHKSNGRWTNPKSLGPNINTNNNYECCPVVTSDNKYLFFTRGGSAMYSYNTYWVKIDNVIDSLKHTNFVPYLMYQIPNLTDTVNHQLAYTVPDSTFVDDNGNNTLTYSATLSSGGSLPSWITFSPAAKTFLFNPTTTGTTGIKVIATDSANVSISCTFYLEVVNNTAIHQLSEQVSDFKLFQNYPNPFNPVTIIRFNLPAEGNVSLKIYDFLGREVETLVNEFLRPGAYSAEWNASQYSSGLYFYKLTVGNYTETKKMTVLK